MKPQIEVTGVETVCPLCTSGVTGTSLDGVTKGNDEDKPSDFSKHYSVWDDEE